MDADGYICLADFGLAKILKGNEMATTFAGTPDYIAPELLQDSVNYSFQVDWWTFGIFGYEITVGCSPFSVPGNDVKKQYDVIKKANVYYPTEQDDGFSLSDELQDFIEKLLDKNPETRLGA